MDPQRVLALCQEHAGAEAAEEMDRVLATMVAEPVFEFYPMKMKIAGRTNIERFYREQYTLFSPLVVGYQVLSEWTNEYAALQEYWIDVTDDTAPSGMTRYFVMSMMPGDDESGLLTGERLYCDDGFVRALLGPLYACLEPIT